MSCSKPVPPPGIRTKRLVIGAVRWEPGRKERAPFSGVHFSSGIQKPTADGGLVYYGTSEDISNLIHTLSTHAETHQECPKMNEHKSI